ncbi:MAG: succinyldiaminopimelate transaminase [Nocardioides sp.]|nr:succinyldiaminopimelate transaminase [Nocardioides sp.]
MPAAVQTSLAGIRDRAAAYAGPVVDLSIGAPIDPTPEVVRRALAAEADSPGYPLTVGRADLRRSVVAWLGRAHGVGGLHDRQVLPVIGTKELIGSLALHLGRGPDDVIAHPRLAYPTYAVGAALVGAMAVEADDVADLEALAAADRTPSLVWVNSPSNPTGAVLDASALHAMVTWCRENDALLVSDECYLDLGWEASPVSVLAHDICGGTHDGLLAVHSLSKRSNLAGYRCGFVTGDQRLVTELASVRRNLGLQLPGPQQGAAIAALGDDAHVVEQRARYAARRDVLRPALEAAGFRVDHSEAGLYLWATREEPAERTVAVLADHGIVAVPGTEYGLHGAAHVRFALTAPDADVALAAQRLPTLPDKALR